jgi:hypothetical protein
MRLQSVEPFFIAMAVADKNLFAFHANTALP